MNDQLERALPSVELGISQIIELEREHCIAGAYEPAHQAMPELGEKVIQALANFDGVARALVVELDNIEPGHPFGTKKYFHCLSTDREAAELGLLDNLSPEEALLSQVILRVHDVGRHKEAILKHDTLRPGVRHGQLSTEILEEAGILDSFTLEQRQDILSAVLYHAESTVPDEIGERAKKLCYILRDTDKVELLSAKKFMTPKGILEQLKLHYLKNKGADVSPISAEDLAHPDFDTVATNAIRNLIEHNTVVNPSASAIAERVEQALTTIMNTGIHPKAIEDFMAGKTIPVQLVSHSYPTYMLQQLALVFDIQSPACRHIVADKGHLRERLSFIERKVDSAEYMSIESRLDYSI